MILNIFYNFGLRKLPHRGEGAANCISLTILEQCQKLLGNIWPLCPFDDDSCPYNSLVRQKEGAHGEEKEEEAGMLR